MVITTEEHERNLKDYASPIVRRCAAEHYRTGPLGYLIMVGGEALNHHLPKDKQVVTSDFDLKFVVAPRFTERLEDLRKANVMRLHIVQKLVRCLSSIKPPKDYTQLYPRITLLKNDVVYEVKIDGNKVFMIDPETGKEKYAVYYFNKIFTIKLAYQYKKEPLSQFTLIDVGLYYRLPEGEPYYNFLSNKIYNTFLYPPFSQPIPIPFEVENGIRYPILPYILVDNFRMILFVSDFMFLYKDNEVKIEFFKKKLQGYHKKMNIVLAEFEKKNPAIVKAIKKQIAITVLYYDPLATLNAICYREEGKANYVEQLQEKKECDLKYQNKLIQFFDEYQKTLNLIAELMPYSFHNQQHKNNSRKNSRKNSRNNSRNKHRSRYQSRNKSYSKKRSAQRSSRRSSRRSSPKKTSSCKSSPKKTSSRRSSPKKTSSKRSNTRSPEKSTKSPEKLKFKKRSPAKLHFKKRTQKVEDK